MDSGSGVCVAGSHVTAARLLAHAAKLQKQLDEAMSANRALHTENAGLRDDVQRLTAEGKELAQKLVDHMSSRPPIPTGRSSSRQRSPSAPRQDRNRSFTSDDDNITATSDSAHSAGQSYGWTARVDEHDHWEYSQDAGGFPIDADYLIRDVETKGLLDRAMRHSPAAAALTRRLVANVAAAERRRNAELETRKAQLQRALSEVAAERCLHDCSARLSAFEKIRTGLQKQHAGKVAALVSDAVRAVRDATVAAQRERADAAERAAAEASRAKSKPVRNLAPDDVSTLPDPSEAAHNRSGVSTLPEPSVAGASTLGAGDDAGADRTRAMRTARPSDVSAPQPPRSQSPPGNATVAAPTSATHSVNDG
eukprot:CAMPEP_0174846786 /NCGR_PEP_ID=MMETSP1114-20130205/12513_1 /TAXON_ID=312471 /ORGANISM="Neobodo designis, Strain CCAP 1951/1" /LENGTH=365 /DNA_ID=CAMNT_0016081053 /DNA_START=36 /DNA_END=1130 /DNA_ORIENTATION=+